MRKLTPMNYLLFTISSAIQDFRRNKVRTFLTSLGILIGVSSVVLLMAFGLGFKKYIQGQFESLGTNLVIIFPGQVIQNGRFRQGGPPVSVAKFDEKDITSLQKIKSALFVVPVSTKTVNVRAGASSETSDIFMSTADIFPTRNLEVQSGKIFTKSDLENRNKVAVIGPKIAEKLFGESAVALGKTIQIESQRFLVLGVLKSKGGGGFGGPDFDSFIYLPHKSALTFNPDKKFLAFYIKAESPQSIPQIKEEAKTVLLRRYKEDDFSITEQTEILNAVGSIFAVLNLVLISIAAISLIVGGIGIMNIMYVSVTERIKEIGIRRAVGATEKDILYQFLAESVILSLTGGVLGLLLSFFIVLLVQRVFPAYINLASIAISISISSLIGIVFGVFPARKAAHLSPIEAIRYE